MYDGVYQLFFLRPEALLSNETWTDMVPSPVYQENLVAVVIDEFYQRTCHVTLGSNVNSALERKRGICYQTYFSFPFPAPFPWYLSLSDVCHRV